MTLEVVEGEPVVDKSLQYVEYLYLKHVDSTLTNIALYKEIRSRDTLAMYGVLEKHQLFEKINFFKKISLVALKVHSF